MGALHAAALRGFLFPESRLPFDALFDADTNFTEGGPRPGSPVAKDGTSNALIALSGGQSADVDILFTSAGFPGVDPAESCRVAWKFDTEPDAEWRGWSPPSFPHSMYAISIFSTSIDFPVFDIVTIPSTQKVIAMSSRSDGSTLTRPSTRTLDPADWTLIDNGDLRPSDIDVAARNSCLVVLPNEITLCIEYATTVSPSLFNFWTVFQTNDDGASWPVYARNPIPIDTSLLAMEELRACMVGKNVVMAFANAGGASRQYASNSLGTRFTQVGTEWTVDAPEFLNMKTLKSGRAAIVYFDGADVVYKSIGSAYESIEAAAITVIEAGVGDVDHIAMWVDGDGAIWVIFFAGGSTHTHMWVSYNEGVSWIDVRTDATIRGPFNSGESGSYLQFGAGTTSSGRHITLHNSVDSSGGVTFDGVCMLTMWGGWSNVEALGFSDASNGRIWFPYEIPDTIFAWTSVGGGSAVLTSPGFMNVNTAINTRFWNHTSVWGTVKHDFIGYTEIDVRVGGSVTTNEIANSGGQGDGFNAVVFEVIYSTTQYAVESNGSGRGTVTHGANNRLGVIWYYNSDNDTMSTWFRDVEDAGNWVRGHDEVAITPFASGASGFYRWGHIAVSSSTSRWHAHHILWSTVSGSLKPAADKLDLVAKTMSALPYPINEAGTEASAAFLAALAGPAKRLEEWGIDALHDFGRERAFSAENPSPAEPWRGLTVDPITASVPEEIPFAWNLINLTFLSEGSIGLALLNTNVRTAVVEGSTGGAYSTIGTMDLQKSVSFTRDGDVVTAAPGTDFGRYLFRGELNGAWIDLGGGVNRKIRLQTEGVFDGDITTRQARLYLEGITGSEPTSGTATIVSHSGVLVLHNVAKFSKFRLKLPAGTNADGFKQIGTHILGPIAVAGKQWSRGWSWEHVPNAETRTDRKGTTRVRELGDVIKQLTVSWSDGANHAGLRSGDPDFLSADTGDPLATRDDVAWWLAGLMAEWKSAQVPVVCLTAIPKASGTTITDPSLFLYSRISSSVGLDNVTGDEDGAANRKEFVRVPSVTFRGIP